MRKFIKIEDCQEKAKLKNGLCLSTKYINSYTNLEWQCEFGHIWNACWDNIKQNKWCKKCATIKNANKLKLTIKDCQKLAELKNGKCLSTTYISAICNLMWKCKYNHTWETSYNTIHQGHWCPECAGNKKSTIEEIQKLATSKGGECLSKIYINDSTNLEFKCKENHIWKTSPSHIKQGSWCKECAGLNKKTIKDCQKIAKLKNGLCLSIEYINVFSKLDWQCEVGHIFSITYNDVQQGSWCKKCALKRRSDKRRGSIKNCQKLAELKNGKCLSTEYKTCMKKLKWECAFGHTWKTSQNRIQQGSWCPDCKIPLSELICKYVIEQIFNKPFEKIRPTFLKNPKTNKNLEIDLYNKELNIGFEHNGIHHYKDNIYSTQTLQQIQERDQLKLKLCKQNNTKLIIIPELFKQTKLKDLQNFIITECKKQNIPLPNIIPKIEIDVDKIIRDFYINILT